MVEFLHTSASSHSNRGLQAQCKFTCNSGSFVIRIERDSACGLTVGQDTALRSSGTHLRRPPIPSCKSEASCSVRSGTEEFYCIQNYKKSNRLSNILTFNMIPIGSHIKCNLIGRKHKCLCL